MSLPLADELLLHLAAPDRRAAAAHGARLVDGGLALHELVDDGLAPAMRQVGSLWESAVWTVVDEHLATAVAEATLSSAAFQQPVTRTKGDVVVACTEGDWHSLPARMVAEVLLTYGWAVRFLGASQPTSQLVDYVTRHRPDAVLLSCAVPMALPALVTAVTTLHDLGLPVHVGGRALTPARADAIGADGYSTTASGAAALLELPAAPGGAGAAGRLADYRARGLLFSGWVDAGMQALMDVMPAVAHFPEDIKDRTAADLLHLLDCACIGLLLDDPLLMDEQCGWLTRILAARGVPAQALQHGLVALRRVRPPVPAAAAVGEVLERQRARLASTVIDAA